jgi:hypothetical protein
MNFRQWLQSQDSQKFDVVDAIKTAKRAWWRYGNYCGPGPKFHPKTCKHLSTGEPLPSPENQVDSHCKNHDIDYCKCGVKWTAALPGQGNDCSRKADRKLTANLIMNKEKLPATQKKAAEIISGYFGQIKRALE